MLIMMIQVTRVSTFCLWVMIVPTRCFFRAISWYLEANLVSPKVPAGWVLTLCQEVVVAADSSSESRNQRVPLTISRNQLNYYSIQSSLGIYKSGSPDAYVD